MILFHSFECVNAPYLQDGFDQVWKKEKVASHVEQFVHKYDIKQVLIHFSSINFIDSIEIITFDDYGVSGHPNHIATYHGVK